VLVGSVAEWGRASLPSQARELAREAAEYKSYKVRFIREKGKATAREVQRSLEAGSSLLR
jgi:hypothetical protein